MSARSAALKCSAPCCLRRASSTAAPNGSPELRATTITWWPALARLLATPSPMPRVPPVTTMLGTWTHQLAGGRNIQIRDKSDGDRNLVCRQAAAAGCHDFPFQLLGSARCLGLGPGEHVGCQEEAGDWVLPCSDERHLDLGMTIDDGFNFFGMNLQPADIDDTAPAANEMVAIASLLEHIAGVD